MYSQKVKILVEKFDRLNEWYNISPIQKCILEGFVDEVLREAALIAESAAYHKLSPSAYNELMREEFNLEG